MDKAWLHVTKNRPGDLGFWILVLEKSIRQNSLPCYNKEQQDYVITYLFAHNAMLNRVEGELNTVYAFMEQESQDSKVG